MILSTGTKRGWTGTLGTRAARKGRLLISASLLLCVGCVAAASGSREQRIIFGPSPRNAKSVLDLRVEQIDLNGSTMYAALRAIEDAVPSSRQYSFAFGVRTARKISERPGREVRIEEWLRNPKVQLHATNTTLCAVINDLCAQSGWSYAWFGDGLGFIDDRSYFGAKPFDCYNDRGEFFKRQPKQRH